MNFKNTILTPSEYACIHIWIKKNYGKANHCENPNCPHKNPIRFEWALIHGKEYDRKIENFIQLCKSCHLNYDKKSEWGEKISRGQKNSEKNRIPWNKGKTKETDSRIKSPPNKIK